MLDFTLHRKIARIIKMLAETLHVCLPRAVSIFYRAGTCKLMHDSTTMLHTMSDTYILNDVISELKEYHGRIA